VLRGIPIAFAVLRVIVIGQTARGGSIAWKTFKSIREKRPYSEENRDFECNF